MVDLGKFTKAVMFALLLVYPILQHLRLQSTHKIKENHPDIESHSSKERLFFFIFRKLAVSLP